MKDSSPIAIVGGYDSIARSFYSKTKLINNDSIFINVSSKKVKKRQVFNYEIFELKKILKVLKKYKIRNLLFLGKINRPNLSNFQYDGEIDKHIPALIKSYKEGDGKVLLSVLKIFNQKGFNILSPQEVSQSFFLNKNEVIKKIDIEDSDDINKSVKLLNDLSKYDNAQSIVSINGYIIAIEAVEGTDNLLKRTRTLRKKLGQLEIKSGILTKIPKKNQSRLVDLPVIGIKTLKLINAANLNGIAIKANLTIIHNKKKFLQIANDSNLKIYNIS